MWDSLRLPGLGSEVNLGGLLLGILFGSSWLVLEMQICGVIVAVRRGFSFRLQECHRASAFVVCLGHCGCTASVLKVEGPVHWIDFVVERLLRLLVAPGTRLPSSNLAISLSTMFLGVLFWELHFFGVVAVI